MHGFEGITDGIKAVIFDLDGTLIDSMWLWKQIDIDFLGKFGIELPDDFQEAISGMSFVETASYSKKRFSLPIEIEEIMDTWNGMAEDFYRNRVKLKKGALRFLKFLKEKDIRTGIATSNSKELVEIVAESLGMTEYIGEIHNCCEVKKGKPSPLIYLHVADCLNVKPEECLVFEDLCVGIEAGKAAGMRTVAVKDDFSEAEWEKKKEMADYYIEDYDVLCDSLSDK